MPNQTLKEELRAFLPPQIYKDHQVSIIANWWLSKIKEIRDEIKISADAEEDNGMLRASQIIDKYLGE